MGELANTHSFSFDEIPAKNGYVPSEIIHNGLAYVLLDALYDNVKDNKSAE